MKQSNHSKLIVALAWVFIATVGIFTHGANAQVTANPAPTTQLTLHPDIALGVQQNLRTQKLGDWGEDVVDQLYRSRGYEIVDSTVGGKNLDRIAFKRLADGSMTDFRIMDVQTRTNAGNLGVSGESQSSIAALFDQPKYHDSRGAIVADLDSGDIKRLQEIMKRSTGGDVQFGEATREAERLGRHARRAGNGWRSEIGLNTWDDARNGEVGVYAETVCKNQLAAENPGKTVRYSTGSASKGGSSMSSDMRLVDQSGRTLKYIQSKANNSAANSFEGCLVDFVTFEQSRFNGAPASLEGRIPNNQFDELVRSAKINPDGSLTAASRTELDAVAKKLATGNGETSVRAKGYLTRDSSTFKDELRFGKLGQTYDQLTVGSNDVLTQFKTQLNRSNAYSKAEIQFTQSQVRSELVAAAEIHPDAKTRDIAKSALRQLETNPNSVTLERHVITSENGQHSIFQKPTNTGALGRPVADASLDKVFRNLEKHGSPETAQWARAQRQLIATERQAAQAALKTPTTATAAGMSSAVAGAAFAGVLTFAIEGGIAVYRWHIGEISTERLNEDLMRAAVQAGAITLVTGAIMITVPEAPLFVFIVAGIGVYYLTDVILDSAMGRDNEHLIAEETRLIYDGKPLQTETKSGSTWARPLVDVPPIGSGWSRGRNTQRSTP